MYRLTLPLIAIILVAMLTAATAAEFPTYGQFRYASGLPGGTFGVDPEGHAGFEGAMQINIPIGYTPGAGNWALVPSSGRQGGGFPDRLSGANVDGTVAWGLGFGGPDHALWVMDMMTGNDHSYSGHFSGESAYNAQFQLVRPTKNRPGIAIGGIDITNLRPAITSKPLDAGGRSLFAVATWEAGTPEKPLYYTLGIGNGRFSPLFAGVSYQPASRLKLMAEYDSLDYNIGAAYKLYQLSERWQATLGVSLIDLDRANIGISLTRSSVR